MAFTAVAHDAFPIRQGCAVVALSPGRRQREGSDIARDGAQFFLLDQVLRADPLRAEPARSDPASNRLRVSTHATSRFWDRDHVVCYNIVTRSA
jgi:hypothetical protein